jgi:hypothetical protein
MQEYDHDIRLEVGSGWSLAASTLSVLTYSSFPELYSLD